MWREQLATLSREYAGLDMPTGESCDGPLVLHWAFIGGSIGLLNREILMALALRIRGARPRIVLCDGLCSGCQIRTYRPEDRVRDWKRICANCIAAGRRLVESAGIKHIPLSELVTTEQAREARELADSADGRELRGMELDGYPLGLYAMSATTRYFRSLPRAVPAEDFEPILREYMYTALVSMRASVSALRELQPNILLTTHNIYSEWGPAYRTFSQSGVPVYWHIASILQNHIMIRRCNGEYTSHPYYCDEDCWKRRSGCDLTQSQDAALDRFMDVICEGKNSLMEYFGESPQPPSLLRKRFDIPAGVKVWGIFSPLPWDAHLCADPLLFGDVDEWLVETVKCAASIKDVLWLVKMHPTESLRQTRMSMEQVLAEAFPSLPENIRLISGRERINTHGLIGILDGGITTRGTTGLELALQGKQAMASGSSHYGFKGFTLDSRTTDDYFRHMRSAPGLGPLSSDQVRLARRYSYDFFIRRNLPFEPYDQNSMKVNGAVLKGLSAGDDSVLRSICDGILHKEKGSLERPE